MAMPNVDFSLFSNFPEECLDSTMNNFPIMANDQLGNNPITARLCLKKSIEEKKLAKGEEIPQIEYKSPPPPQPKAPEKPEDLKRKREKNKIAAMKCRQKKRARRDCLLQKIKKWEDLNEKKRNEVQKLLEEKERLEKIVEKLNAACICSGITSVYQPNHEFSAPVQQGPLGLLGNAASSVEEMPFLFSELT